MRSTNILALVLVAFSMIGAACGGTAASIDGGTGAAVCELRGGTASPCSDLPPELGAENCRCGSHYYWTGTACVATAACRCLARCERLFETEAACVTAYAACGADAGS